MKKRLPPGVSGDRALVLSRLLGVITHCGGLEAAKFVDVKEVSVVLFPEDQSNPWDKKELGEVSMELTRRMPFDMQKMWDRPA